MINKKNKHGDISSGQLVLYIILVLSFAIIIIFLIFLNPGRETESQICHNSVVTRSTNFITQKILTTPITCKTSYICLSKDGSCERMSSPEIKKVNTKEEIYEALAEQGADCWWKFGEGKLDYVGTELRYEITQPQPKLYCSICSQVAFDDSLYSMFVTDLGIPDLPTSEMPSLIEKNDFYNYLANTNVPGKETTYLEYFTGLRNSEIISETLESNNVNFGYIDVKKQQLIIMGEFSVIGKVDQFLNDVISGAYLPINLLIRLFIPREESKAYLLGIIVQGESEHNYLAPTIVEANSEEYQQLMCEDVNTLA